MEIDIETFLEHHGVRGQKWGIRHQPVRSSGPGRSRSSSSGAASHPKKASISVDETPWSNYKESDYTPAQWHNASLIHDHPPGVPTTKNHCKLPVKTPGGVVNRHGVYAAAAVLAGSRGGVNATSEQKNSAAASLRRIYEQMGATPPPSLHMKHMDINEAVDTFLEHHGVKGMKWGIRHDPKARGAKPQHTKTQDFKRVEALRHVPVWALSDEQIRLVNNRLNLESQFYKLNPGRIHQGRKEAEHILATVGIGVAAYNLVKSPAGKALIDLGKKVITR